MSNEQYVRDVLRSTDPARDLVVSPRVPASAIIANSKADSTGTLRHRVQAHSRRRLLLAGVAVTAAGAGSLGVASWMGRRDPGIRDPMGRPSVPVPSGSAAGGPPVFAFPALVRPMA